MDRDTYVAHVERTRRKKNRGVLAALRVSVRRCFRVSCVQVSSAASGGRSIRAEIVAAQTMVRVRLARGPNQGGNGGNDGNGGPPNDGGAPPVPVA